MSETVHYIGKIKPVEKFENETLEEQCKRILEKHNYLELSSYCNSWEEMIYDKLYEKYVIHNKQIYEVIENNYIGDYGDVFNAHKNTNGIINFEVMYYDGGCSFNEAITQALDNMDT